MQGHLQTIQLFLWKRHLWAGSGKQSNFVVPDVAAQDNYIACSITVKGRNRCSLFVSGENIGQIDIDSNTPDPFQSG